MKILDAGEIRKLDIYTIENEPIKSVDLMERAAKQCFLHIKKLLNKPSVIRIFCGMGNNGGDGLAIARMLAATASHEVLVYKVKYGIQLSPDCAVNENRLEKVKKVKQFLLTNETQFPNIQNNDLVIDAMFGTGLSRPLDGFPARVVRHINQSQAKVISIDIPSGLFCEDNRGNNPENIIKAWQTLTFQMPKLAFLLAGNHQFVGQWHVLDIGLHPSGIEAAETTKFIIEASCLKAFYRPRSKFSHKGTYGHALLIAGSTGKAGAAILAASAALRSGLGLLTAHLPAQLVPIMQTALPEAMCVSDNDPFIVTDLVNADAYNAIAVGPGLGTDPKTANALKYLIQSVRQPTVFDADALNILAENKTWLSFMAPGSILTPHPKEFERLAGKCGDDFEMLETASSFAMKYQVYVVLKGTYSAVCCPDKKVYFNTTGNPGMATAGSGDVLTGSILAWLAQGYMPLQSSLAAVFFHGIAGNVAATRLGYSGMTASDIIFNTPKAIKRIVGE